MLIVVILIEVMCVWKRVFLYTVCVDMCVCVICTFMCLYRHAHINVLMFKGFTNVHR